MCLLVKHSEHCSLHDIMLYSLHSKSILDTLVYHSRPFICNYMMYHYLYQDSVGRMVYQETPVSQEPRVRQVSPVRPLDSSLLVTVRLPPSRSVPREQPRCGTGTACSSYRVMSEATDRIWVSIKLFKTNIGKDLLIPAPNKMKYNLEGIC